MGRWSGEREAEEAEDVAIGCVNKMFFQLVFIAVYQL